MASAVLQAIHGIIASPDQAIGAVSIFSNQHLAQVAEWNGRHPVLDPPATSIYELIQPLCRSQPDAPAISAWDGEVSYGQMDAWTGQLAGYLTKKGVEPNTVVALCFGKSLWAMISMLAVIRTGGAFVFLDPSHPAPHRKHILSQACPILVLTSPPHERLFEDEEIPVVSVTKALVLQLLGPSSSGGFKPANEPQGLAYLVFTSGSSGTPKGCAIDHESLASMIPLGRPWPFDKTCNRIFQFAPFVFGTSMLEILSAWLIGGVLCLSSDDEWRNDLVGAIARSKATGLVLPVSLAKLISPDMIPTVRMLAVGGEPLDDILVDRWADRVRLVQGYGMSENAGILTIKDGLTRESDPRNVGQSPNGRIWLVSPDDHNQLVPIGAVAEILFESPGIARKYLNHPEKSSATFVEPPPWLQQFTTLSGRGRFLKSGDLARYSADGTISHLGRKDSQVKIRGQRVDVKEVELSLRLHLGTTVDFFVELVRPKNGSPILAAFMLFKESDKSMPKSTGDHDLVVIPSSLRSQLETVDSSLRSSLPNYMVPTVYLLMAKLPTTMTGKVDRRKLREHASALTRAELESLMHGQPNEQMLPPTTPMEQRLAHLIAGTLRLEKTEVGMNTNFLKLGGDSITAMDFVRRCRAERIVITLQHIFQEPTIAGLALRAQALPGLDEDDFSSFDKNYAASFGLTATQRHLLPAGQSSTGWRSVVFRFRQPQRSNEVADAIRLLVTRHPMLRARFLTSENGEEARQMMTEAMEESYLFQDEGILDDDKMANLQVTSQKSMDPYIGPVFAAHLTQTGDGEQMLLLVAHDLILDDISWKIIQVDLDQLLSGNTETEVKDAPSFQTFVQEQGVSANQISQELSSEGWTDYSHDWNLATIPEIKHAHRHTVTLGSDYTHPLFGNALESLQVQPWQVVLAALFQSFSSAFPDRKSPSFATQFDGRDTPCSSNDFSRTVGRFDHVLLCTGPEHSASLSSLDLVRRIKDSSWLSLVKKVLLPAVANVDIVFHNRIASKSLSTTTHDRVSQSKQLSAEGPGLPRCLGLLEVFATASTDSSDDTLELSYVSSDTLGAPELIQHWFSLFQQQLSGLLRELQKTTAIFTLSSFPSIPLNYRELDHLENDHLPQMGIEKHDDMCDAYPCSSMQQGMLLAKTVDPSRYKTRTMWKTSHTNSKEVVDTERLRGAWSAVVQRHPALRTVFSPHPGDNTKKHLQLILSPAKAGNLATVVHGGEEPSSVQARKHSLPHLRLQKRTSGDVDCLLEIDHTVTDGFSTQILMRDLALAYDGRLSVDCVPQFREHVMRHETLPKEDAEAYWATLLRNCNPCQFPIMNKERGDHPARAATYHAMEIELGPSSLLYDVSRKHGVTVSNIFQVTWALVLQAFTGQSSVCFGYMVSGRDSSMERIWDAVGLFTNMVTRVIDLGPQKTPLGVLQETQRDFVDSLPYQHVTPLDISLQVGISLHHLFNTMVSFSNAMADSSTSGGSLKFEVTDVLDYSEFDVTLEGSELDGKIGARIKYWDSILSHEQAQRVAGVFQQAIDLLLTSPQQPLNQLYLLSGKDERQIMEWNDSPRSPVDSCIHGYIEEQCRTSPLAPAVNAWNGSFTYQELSSLSSRLAAHLCKSGVRPGAIVPVCFEKSCWTPVAMLAVLRSGGTFVLLNPTLPTQRLQDICQTIDARIILTSAQNAAMCCAELGQKRNVITVDDEQHWNNDSTVRQWTPPTVTGADTAYIVFTSGSTGAPKGTMVHHSAFLGSALSYGPPLHLNSEVRVLQFSSYSFDICVSDHLATLLAGGCICIPSDAELKADLSSAIKDYQVNWAMMTPSVSRIIEPDSVPGLETLCLIGEALSASDVRSWSKHVRLMNTYGPAETACVSHGNLDLKPDQESKNIGRGLGAISWIVDQNNPERLMPVGTVGELLIDGPIVGQGYLNDPEKTNSAFIDCLSWMSRFRPGHKAKLYKTGDLVRYMDDGSILFCGRKNTQVKVRGQWVELSEVENYSRQCFSGASQLMVEHAEEHSVLVGFVPWAINGLKNDTAATDYLLLPATPEFQEQAFAARKRMLDSVSEHMVPAAFIPVSHIPLGPTGKADRRQLRDELRTMSRQDLWKYVIGGENNRPVMPSTELETKLQRIFVAVLGVPAETIGVDDDFFNLGGNSLVAMRISSHARTDGLHIGFADLFQHRTIRQLALCIAELDSMPRPPVATEDKNLVSSPWENGTSGLLSLHNLSDLKIPATDVEAVLPCTPMQGLMLRTQRQGSEEVYTLRFSVQVSSQSSDIDAAKLQDTWQAVINRHTTLRTVFVARDSDGDSHAQVIISSAALSGSPGDSLMAELPYQIAFVQSSPNTVTMTGHMNHALGDAASTAVLLDEVRRGYRNQSLETIAPQFTPYVHYMQSSRNPAIKYWSEYFQGVPACLFPCQGQSESRGHLRNQQVSITQDPQAIFKTSQQNKHTIPTIIKSAWALTLSFWTRADSVCFGYLTSGRDAPIPDVEAIVGPLLNLLVCRLDCESLPSLGHVMIAVQSDYIKSLAHHPGTIPALQQLPGPLFNTLVNHRQYQTLDPTVIGDSDLEFRMVSQKDPMNVCSIPLPPLLLFANTDHYKV